MAEFEVKIYKIEVEEHPNADVLDLAKVGEYRSIIGKDSMKTGDLAAYIPEGAIVPEWLIVKLNLVGRLAGKAKNRVKAIKLRGIVSQGLIVPLVGNAPPIGFPYSCSYAIENRSGFAMGVGEGDDVTDFLDITKYEPPIPTNMGGEVFNAFGHTIKYDIENIKKFPDVILHNEEVVITEKIHGTWTCFGYHSDVGKIITSKGLSAKGLAFKLNDTNKNNLYIRTLKSTVTESGDILDKAISAIGIGTNSIYLLGETFGSNVQDLSYGSKTPAFRLFDVYINTPSQGRYLNTDEMIQFAELIGVETVPILYSGPYDSTLLTRFTSGKETVSGLESNIREGIVVKPMKERRDTMLGRVIVKSISDNYLLRKGTTTEFT
jgi:RNA ligase (TIGR02306 family)